MKTWPLRWQITLWAAVFTGLAVTIFGLVVAYNLYGEQVEVIDGELAATARVLFERGAGADLRLEGSEWFKPGPHRQVPLYGYAVAPTAERQWTHVYPAQLAPALPPWPLARRRFTSAIDGIRVRSGVFQSGSVTLVLATSLEPAEESVEDLAQAYLIALPLVVLFVAAGSAWIARRALRPIVRLTQTAESITASRLGERVPAPRTNDEIGAHVRVLNGMLDRLQRSFEQANRFTADAAHELRTPLTIMRGQIEDALRSGQVGAEPERLLSALLEETAGLQKIADNLLLLARFDTGKGELQCAPLDLTALLEDAREDAELLAARTALKVTAELAPAARVDGDRLMLRRLVLNLIDNAVKFNRPGGEVRLRLVRGERDVNLTIGNTGAGIPAERRASLFARFYRADPSRERDSGGSGLGLSLCREIATAHGGTIELARAEADWTEFSVRLPRGGADPK
ncbi:MAG TPA: ATP-binding protein [Opitutaceae bacterium]|nr:ATP-binding protein [Opitutaceae bacterium]